MTQYIISANLPEILALEDAGKQEEAYALAHTKIGEQLQDALQCMAEARAAGGGDNALVIDGKALLHGLAHDLKAQLLQASSPPLAVVQQRGSCTNLDCANTGRTAPCCTALAQYIKRQLLRGSSV